MPRPRDSLQDTLPKSPSRLLTLPYLTLHGRKHPFIHRAKSVVPPSPSFFFQENTGAASSPYLLILFDLLFDLLFLLSTSSKPATIPYPHSPHSSPSTAIIKGTPTHIKKPSWLGEASYMWVVFFFNFFFFRIQTQTRTTGRKYNQP